MLWIGLTGGIASGKSTVSKILKGRGFPIVDADELVRLVSQKGTNAHAEIVQAFGPDSVSDDGALNRKRIGEVVFSDRTRLDLLEGILHPLVRDLAKKKREELRQAGAAIAFYDVPLLFEKNMESLFDRVVVVVCSRAQQLERLMRRNGFSLVEAERRLQAQLPLEEKAKRGHEVIVNDGSLVDLERAVDAYLAGLRVTKPKHNQ